MALGQLMVLPLLPRRAKKDDLLRVFKNVLNGALDYELQSNGEDSSTELKKCLTVTAGEGNEVVIRFIAPDDVDFVQDIEQDILEAVNAAKPKFIVKASSGRTFGEMLEHKDESLLVVSKGASGSVSAEISTGFFESALEDVPEEYRDPHADMLGGILAALKSSSFSMHTVYKKDKVAQIEFPTLGMVLSMIGDGMRHGIPASVRDPLIGFDEFSDGITKMDINGLPGDFRMDFVLNNVRVAPLFKELLADMMPAE